MDYSLKEPVRFDENATEEELLQTVADWLKESETYHNQLLKKQKLSLEYYHGNQTDVSEVPNYLSDTVENRIFEGIETLVPIATANAHHFAVLPGSEEETSKMRAESLQKVMTRKYETLNIQEKLEMTARDMLIQRFGVLRWDWDYEKNDIEVRRVDPKLILVPKLRVEPENLPYVMEVQGYTREELEEEFEVNADDIAVNDEIDVGDKGEKKKEYQVLNVWTDDYVVWRLPGKILKRDVNPYFDFTGEEIKERVEGQAKREKVQKFYNHLDNPEKPYVFFSLFNVSDGPLPDTSLVEIVMPIQDAINAQKRSIINNLKQVGNGQVYVDSDAMTEEEADNMTNEPGLVIRGQNVASENKIRREAGIPLPNAHFSNLQHSETVFDNIMGVHSATRGAAQGNTLGQDIISRQQDFTRIDLVTRELNRGVAKLANGLVQLMKLFYTETQLTKILGEDGSVEFVKLNRDDIEDAIEIYVKGDNALPMDEISKRTEAVQLWQLQAIDPTTLFERLKFPNPAKAAERLILWRQGQLDRETQAKIQEAQGISQVKQEGQPSGQASGQARSETQDVGNIETIRNSVERAKQAVGGAAPIGTTPNQKVT